MVTVTVTVVRMPLTLPVVPLLYVPVVPRVMLPPIRRASALAVPLLALPAACVVQKGKGTRCDCAVAY